MWPQRIGTWRCYSTVGVRWQVKTAGSHAANHSWSCERKQPALPSFHAKVFKERWHWSRRVIVIKVQVEPLRSPSCPGGNACELCNNSALGTFVPRMILWVFKWAKLTLRSDGCHPVGPLSWKWHFNSLWWWGDKVTKPWLDHRQR